MSDNESQQNETPAGAPGTEETPLPEKQDLWHDIMEAVESGQRRADWQVFSPTQWRKRAVFWLGAIGIGIFASAFTKLADFAQKNFIHIAGEWPLLPLLMTPAAFLLIAYAAKRWFPSTPGSGIPQAIAAMRMRDPATIGWLVGPRVIVGKIVLTAAGLFCGASIGREGPTVQVGASLLLLCSRFNDRSSESGIILAGAAAGVAAAFNTPLAGIVFAIEEMARGFHRRNNAIVLTAIVLAGVAAMSVLGNYDYFGVADADFSLASDWVAVVVIGIAGGLGGSIFTFLLLQGGKWLRAMNNGVLGRHPFLFAAGCGLVIALLGLATGGTTYGTGYVMAHETLHERISLSWGYTFAKLAATVVSGFSGIPGGIFSPSLSIGASMGSSLAPWFPHASVPALILMSMTAYFAGVTQAPITAAVIVLEITGKSVTPAPLLAVAILATGVARIFSTRSLYHILAADFALKAQAARDAAAQNA